MKNILPERIYNAIANSVDLEKLYEIRLRKNKEIMVNENSVFHKVFAPQNQNYELLPLVANGDDLEYVLLEACQHSLYSYENQIRQGFVTTKSGIRIGICGEVVENLKGAINTIKDISSLVIRIPHEIKNCSSIAQALIFCGDDKASVKNTLIIAPPGAGKTTFLRDIARGLSKNYEDANILICDERGEIANASNGVARLDVGNCDVLSFASKDYVFNEGVRALRPDIIICDELVTQKDCEAVIKLSSVGVKIIASVHGSSQFDMYEKPYFNALLSNQIFERYVILSDRNGSGTYEGILDKNFKVLY